MKKTKVTKAESDLAIKTRIDSDEDFIIAPRHRNSLNTLLKNNPDGMEDKIIARALNMTVEEVNEVYEKAIVKLRSILMSGSDF